MAGRTTVGSRVLALAALASLTAAAAAEADERTTVSAARAVDRTCHATQTHAGAAGVDVQRYTAEATGLVQARLSGGGDWDLGVFDARTGRSVAGSAALAVQRARARASSAAASGSSCRRARVRGSATTARLRVATVALPQARTAADGPTQVVTVRTDSRGIGELQAAGLDVTEHADAGGVDVVLHGSRDRATLRATGMAFDVKVRDVEARDRAQRRADRAWAQARDESALPSGNTTYRRLPDYEAALKQLAIEYPGLVKPITLSHRSLEGRDVDGIEITRDAAERRGRQADLPEARRPPRPRVAVGRAPDRVRLRPAATTTAATRARRGSSTTTRTIVVPIVNPDGFNDLPRGADVPLGRASRTFDYEMKRKNCRVSPDAGGVPRRHLRRQPGRRCAASTSTATTAGFWGGPGASPDWSDDTYRGDGPGLRARGRRTSATCISTRQVTNLITNHTYSNLVLRPPGVCDVGCPLDEALYQELGARWPRTTATRTARRTSSTTRPARPRTGPTGAPAATASRSRSATWTSTRPFQRRRRGASTSGRAPAAGAGKGGNREAYYRDARGDGRRRATTRVIRGRGAGGRDADDPQGVQTATSPVLETTADGSAADRPDPVPRQLESSMVTGGDGAFSWA